MLAKESRTEANGTAWWRVALRWLVRGLGLADTITDDARRRGRILDEWALTLDAALKEKQ